MKANVNDKCGIEALSKSGKRIKLTKSVWYDKILVEHPEFVQKDIYVEDVRETIKEPDYIVEGWAGELLALRWCESAPNRPKHLCVVYREINDEGFIITAFFISRYQKLLRRGIIWQKK